MMVIEPAVKDPLWSTRSLFESWLPEERQSLRGADKEARAELACLVCKSAAGNEALTKHGVVVLSATVHSTEWKPLVRVPDEKCKANTNPGRFEDRAGRRSIREELRQEGK
jgi:hypothetical protein